MLIVQVNNKNKPAMPIPGWVKLTFMGLKCDNYPPTRSPYDGGFKRFVHPLRAHKSMGPEFHSNAYKQ
jgi:hypothetical protein